MPQIKVYRKDTGEIVRVPAHFMDHPVLSQPFRKTPTQKTKDLEKQANAEREAAEAAVAAEQAALAERQAADEAARVEAEQAALAALHPSTERAGAVANPKPANESANAGDDKKE